MTHNPQATRLLDGIRAAGFELRQNWTNRRWDDDDGRVSHFSVADAADGRKPAVRTFVVVEYGRHDGYSLYTEAPGLKVDADVELICGAREG